MIIYYSSNTLIKKYLPPLLCLFLIAFLLAGCQKKPNNIETIIATNTLRVATLKTPQVLIDNPQFPGNIDLHLIRLFAATLGVNVKLLIVDNPASLIKTILEEKADIALSTNAYLGNDPKIGQSLAYLPQQTFSWQLLYHQQQQKPTDLAALKEANISVPIIWANQPKQINIPDAALNFINTDSHVDELLENLSQQKIKHVLIHSESFKIYKHIYPKLRVAFSWPANSPRWLYKNQVDHSLPLTINHFLTNNDKKNIKNLLTYYQVHLDHFDYLDSVKLQERILTRLPQYQQMFKSAADLIRIDWRLLAAISYQESHWDATAISPTGVYGLMMLTEKTAKHIGIIDRTDPWQSVIGGVIYLQKTLDKFPQRIKNPDRTWFAVGAYNIGFGHIEDARIITETQQDDPNNWLAVKNRLPLLTQKKWYEKTKRGYARGYETVTFVLNIRKYYVIMRLLEENEVMALDNTLQ